MCQSGISKFILSRHADKVTRGKKKEESKKYFGITERGEQAARLKVRVLADKVETLPDGSVIILCGVSKAVRTRSTLKVYADELRKLFKDRNDIIFSTELPDEKRGFKIGELKKISARMGKLNNVKAIIIEFPVRINEFIFISEQEEKEKALFLFMKLAKEERFFRRFFPENTVIFLNVGHSLEFKSLFNYLNKDLNLKREQEKFHFWTF